MIKLLALTQGLKEESMENYFLVDDQFTERL